MLPRRILLLLCICLTFSLGWARSPAASREKCADLSRLSLLHAKVTLAEVVAAGAFRPPGLKQGEQPRALYRDAPAFCRIAATLTPTADSEIKVEVWMPLSGWNGRLRGQGNGGFAGYIAYSGLAMAVSQGYASASTDTGHTGSDPTDAKWALNHPDKIVDFGYRAIHEMTESAKSIVQAFYGTAPRRAYFASCSNGGRQALMEAQRFPDDYDGILAGAPANAWTSLVTAGLKLLQTTTGAGYIQADKIPAISKAVIAACDRDDGQADGVLNDPRKCHFDPTVLLCKGADSSACLTAPQVHSLKSIYAGARDSAGHLIFPGFPPGGEEGSGGWATWITGKEEGKSVGAAFVEGYFSDFVYERPGWNYKSANIDDAYRAANTKTGSTLNAVNPDLNPFAAHGGKLIIYHGWNDPAISALNTIHYYDSIVAAQPSAGDFVRLYLLPGMQHCDGGPGATSFGQGEDSPRSDSQHDIFSALVQWVEKGDAPASIIATKYAEDDPAKGVKMTRTIAPYPEVAK